jgi:hypothetical protein
MFFDWKLTLLIAKSMLRPIKLLFCTFLQLPVTPRTRHKQLGSRDSTRRSKRQVERLKNSKEVPMIPRSFEYLAPRTLDEAVSLLQKSGHEAKILSGGQSLIPMAKKVAAYLLEAHEAMIVEGQIHGGLTTGLGASLYKEIQYDEKGMF